MTKKQAKLNKKQTQVKNELNTITVLQNWFQNYNSLPISKANAFDTHQIALWTFVCCDDDMFCGVASHNVAPRK